MSVITDDYVAFCDGLRQVCGIDLSQYKRPQMERRLRSYFERKGMHMLTEALPGLRKGSTELDELLDRVTINVSQLWRHPEQWAWLEKGILAELAQTGRVKAWSAGSSYGAEAYTLAAVATQSVPGARVRILGTDIDRRIVERARAGRFTEEDARSAPSDALARSFERVDGGWQATPALRAITRFEVGDLLRLRPRPESYELILCRNTVIYFAEPVRDELHARLATALRPGGYLVVGSTERVSKPAAHDLAVTHPFVYRKR
jgi:chemotaxis protein methyltransferase CheR